jgi:hypothetical protein
MMVMMSSLAKTDPHRCLRVQDGVSVIGDPSRNYAQWQTNCVLRGLLGKPEGGVPVSPANVSAGQKGGRADDCARSRKYPCEASFLETG